MSKNYKSIFLKTLLFFLPLHMATAQQEAFFSQFYASSLYLNPALSGLEHRFVVSGIHRSQWTGIMPYTTNSLSVIIPFHDKGENAYHLGGFGGNFYSHNAGNGARVTTGFNISGAYNLHIAATTAQTLTFGLQLGLIQVQYDPSKYRWGNNYDPASGEYLAGATDPIYGNGTPTSKMYPDVTAGLIYYYNAGRNIYAPGISFYFGTVFSHISSPNESLIADRPSRVPLLWKLHSGFEIHVARMLNFSPNFIYTRQGSNNFGTIGGSFTYLIPDHDEYFKPTRIVFGSSYRFSDALIFQIGFGSKYYSVGFSYDFYTSAIRSSTNAKGNAFEISLKSVIEFGKKSRKTTKFHTPLM